MKTCELQETLILKPAIRLIFRIMKLRGYRDLFFWDLFFTEDLFIY
jgi:hypothetical protein